MVWHDNVDWFMSILNFPLFELEGAPVSLGKLFFGILVMFVGLAMSKRASKEVDRRLLVRMNVDDHMRYTFKRFIYYFFLFLSALFSLRTMHVPLTVFTVLGGAFAVGIGFGSQNLVNNFISGILVMVERPMRVGDFVEVDGVSGRVQSIGIRSTLVRTTANSLVVVPNTTFIEKNLTNWTLSGTVNSAVRFGVAYGTDTKRLRELCLSVVRDIPGIVASPSPDLIFADFGDNALIFDLAYCLEAVAFPTRRGIDSQIRYRLNELFVQHSIEVPFPQQDVHFKVTQPVPVRVQN
jgi:potassium efflux system protein